VKRFTPFRDDRDQYGTRATRRKATEKTRKRTQRKGACNNASARARAFVGGADARRCVRDASSRDIDASSRGLRARDGVARATRRARGPAANGA